jgi:signal transduction histidine kinase
MATRSTQDKSYWYRSFYWRIGLGFVMCVIGVLVAQSVIFSYIVARSSVTLPGRSPDDFAAIVAGDLGSALAQNPAVDVQAYLVREYHRVLFPVHAVLKDGRVAGNDRGSLSDVDRRAAQAALARGDFRPAGGPPGTGAAPGMGGRPAIAPIRVADEVVGVVVLPPPPVPGMLRDVGRVLSVPGTVVLIVATALAALFIFWPARRRLRALEDASARLGAGDLAARAPERGGDEIARVARAFNRMAAELAARDEAVRTADRLRRQMLADVSHELNTPLTAMRGYLETLHMSDVVLDTQTRERYLETVERETRRLERIVRDLLDLARYENAAAALDIRAFAVERVFDHVLQRHEYEARTRRIALGAQVADNADQMIADPDRIEQVIENLVANALRHTPDGGSIELRADADGDGICLSVVDSGEGIPPEHLPHVFERFYKVDASRSHPSGGSGLGLSIAKAIVERHGGTIGVTSVPGRTEFRIALPNQSASTNL